jgi:hypothetical protein
LLGCHATDDLEGYQVKYLNGVVDEEITELLRHHQAHDFFGMIAKRFWEQGSVVQLISPNDEVQWARVSHHYSQFGIDTVDTVSVSGIQNLMVAGDAASWKLTNYATRFPGLGLSKCLMDAEHIRQLMTSRDMGDHGIQVNQVVYEQAATIRKEDREQLKSINTAFLMEHIFNAHEAMAGQWFKELNNLGFSSVLLDLSKQLSVAHDLLREGRIKEPHLISSNREGIMDESRREQHVSVRIESR